MPPPLKVFLWLLLVLPVVAFTPARFKARRRRCGAPTITAIRSNQDSILKTQTALYATPTPTIHEHHHRNIVVLSHNVSQDIADGFFDTNHLLHGRVDVLVRCANAALWISNNIRKDVTVYLMLFPHNITIEIQGCAVANLNPDERTMGLYIQRTLLVSNLGSRGGDGDGDTDGSTKETSSEDESSRQRLSVELSRLEETKRQRPETVNPFKPGALPKSERLRLSVARKQREAMVRRIKKAAAKQDVDSNNAGADANNSNTNVPPVGFSMHQNDSLKARLEQFSATGPVLMLNELGEPLSNVLEILAVGAEEHADRTDTTMNRTTTLILGDQIGYTESDEKLMAESRSVRQVSLGKVSLLTSQCITISHHYLDLLSDK